MVDEIKNETEGNNIHIVVDETNDACGRQIVNLMIGELTEEKPEQAYLAAGKEFEKTVIRIIQEKLTNFFFRKYPV